MDFELPSRVKTKDQRERRVGVEIEFCHLSLEQTANKVVEVFGGTVEARNSFDYQVTGTRFGTFELHSDASFLHERKWQKVVDLLGIKAWSGTIDEIVRAATDDIIPFEITSPPLPLSSLSLIDELRSKMQKLGALGTYAHFYTAFGLQFNPELPDFRPETLLGYMQAYLLKVESLEAREPIPLVRRILPFIDPFPDEYRDLVLDPHYAPSLNGFMRDYLELNPTRNRSLDWLPLMTYLNKDLVFEYPVEKELVKPRPTLHYRLPSSLIDDPTWTIASEWNKWVEVENLASDRDEIVSRLKHEAYS